MRPAAHVCGHIHEDAGVTWQRGASCAFINASTCTLAYEPEQPPVVFTLRRAASGEVTAHVVGHTRLPEPPSVDEPQGGSPHQSGERC